MKRIIAILLGVSLLSSQACKDGGPEGPPPALPPEASMVADFSNFQNPTPAPGVEPAPGEANVGTNWIYSAATVIVWNTVLAVTLIAPVAAFKAAVGRTPTGESGAWVWRYNFMVGTVQHSARLEARPATGGIDWDMYISQSGGFTDFHWYEGFSKLDGTSGTWSLMLSPSQPVKFLDIVWNRNTTAQTGDIKYTNVMTGSQDNGSYISQAIITGTFDANMELGKASTSNVTRIEWNRATKSGRVRDQAQFGDANWHCWDGSLNNLAC